MICEFLCSVCAGIVIVVDNGVNGVVINGVICEISNIFAAFAEMLDVFAGNTASTMSGAISSVFFKPEYLIRGCVAFGIVVNSNWYDWLLFVATVTLDVAKIVDATEFAVDDEVVAADAWTDCGKLFDWFVSFFIVSMDTTLLELILVPANAFPAITNLLTLADKLWVSLDVATWMGVETAVGVIVVIAAAEPFEFSGVLGVTAIALRGHVLSTGGEVLTTRVDATFGFFLDLSARAFNDYFFFWVFCMWSCACAKEKERKKRNKKLTLDMIWLLVIQA